MLAWLAESANTAMAYWGVAAQDYMYEVLDRDTVPGGRSIWIIDMKGKGNLFPFTCLVHKQVLHNQGLRGTCLQWLMSQTNR